MRARLYLGALALVVLFAASASAWAVPPTPQEPFFPVWPSRVQEDLSKIQRGFRGEFAVYLKELGTGTRYTYNAATPMYLASGVKVPVMVALFREVEAGRVSLDDELVLKPEDVRDGAPLLNYLRVGTPVTVNILLEAMIQQSDNVATDMIINHLGVDKVNQALKAEGLEGFGPITTLIDVRRLVYRNLDPRTAALSPADIFTLRVTNPLEARLDRLAEMLGEPPGRYSVAELDRAYRQYYEQGYNSAPVELMAALLERIVRGQAVSPRASQAMLEIMQGTQTGNRRVKAGLGADVTLAHKTGTQYQRTCDFGVFYLGPERPVIFAIAVKGGSRAAAEAVMAKVARSAYRHLSGDTSVEPEPEPALSDEVRATLDPEELELLEPTPPKPAPKKAPAGKKAGKKKKGSKKAKKAAAPPDDGAAL